MVVGGGFVASWSAALKVASGISGNCIDENSSGGRVLEVDVGCIG